jgi:cysteine desulfurase
VASHKLYGPKGIGALYVRQGTLVEPLLHGAPQEAGRRPGTENTPGIIGLGAACALAAAELPGRAEHALALTSRLWDALSTALPGTLRNGPAAVHQRLPNTLNISLPGVPAQRLLALVEGVALSAGAACHAGSAAPSGVLLAMGLNPQRAACALRLSTGRGNTAAEMDTAAAALAAAAVRAGSA